MSQDSVGLQLQHHREWLANNGDRIEQRELRYIEQEFADGSPQACLVLTDCLDGLATVYGVRGILDAADGSGDWESQVARAFDYWGWSLKIRAHACFVSPLVKRMNLTNHISRAACLVCSSDAWAGIAGAVLRRAAAEPGAIDEKFWQRRRFEPFVLACLDFAENRRLESSGQLRDPYVGVLESISRIGGVPMEMMASMCDYQLMNISDSGRGRKPEFTDPPFDLLPCEIMIVNQLLEVTGRPHIKELDHRLVRLSGRTTRLGASKSADALIDRVESFFESCYG
ncbi:hypothetical protein [Aquisphaera insulae]|uniref:hypothetical protein n=1 Tax=Aquisphaera insulae TaxID=2712864 RepID=UPI0013EBA47D|nr:hypothetical protein [Aquisphaera insulae]